MARQRAGWRTLAVVGVALFGLLVGLVPGPSRAAAQDAPEPPRAGSELAGTWLLVRAEKLGNGPEPTLVSSPRGMLVLDTVGHVLEITARGDRIPGARFQMTQEEAMAEFNDFAGFWGRYRAGRVAGRDTITYRVEAGVDPKQKGTQLVRTYALSDDRVTMTSTDSRPDAPGGMRWEWQRVPNLEPLTPAHRELVGFWQHVVEWREAQDGTELSRNTRDPSVIVYTPAGFVGVHFPPAGREDYVGSWPSGQAAQAALAGYVGYYGTYSLHPGQVMHHRLLLLGRAPGDTLRRFYTIESFEPPEPDPEAPVPAAEGSETDDEEEIEIPPDEITLEFPLNTGRGGGPPARTMVRLRRLSGIDEMLGR